MKTVDIVTEKATEEAAAATEPRQTSEVSAPAEGRRVLSRVPGVIGCLAALILLFFANGWRVTVRGSEKPEMVAFPAAYEPAEVTATLSGRWLFRGGISLPVKSAGTVDASAPGHYAMAWRADFLFWHDELLREVTVADVTPPKITLIPETREYVLPNLPYDDPGFSAADDADGDVTDRVIARELDGVLYYTAEDRAGNRARAARRIPYGDPVPPVITLLGDPRITLNLGDEYVDPGFTATDNVDGDITDRVLVSGSVNTARPGYYTLSYTVQDGYNNTGIASRTVLVKGFTPSPAPAPAWSGGGALPDKAIFLTFDDGPGPYTNELLDILAKYNVKATFFVVKGKHTEGEMDIISREAAEGHTVAIHSYSHDYKTIYANERAYFADLNAINDVIFAKTGYYASLVRFPGGSSNSVSRFNPGIMTRLAAAVEEAGYRYFDWNVSSGDAGNTTSSDVVFNNVIRGCGERNVSVVLQHDIKKFSVEAVERIIQWGLANGYTFLPLTPDSPGAHHRITN